MAKSRIPSPGTLRRSLQDATSSRTGARVGLFSFFGEVVSELKKVTWPTRQETTRLTLLVVAVSVTVGVVLGAIDLGFSGAMGVLF